MKTVEIISIFDKHGFDFKAFEFENEYSGKAILSAVNEILAASQHKEEYLIDTTALLSKYQNQKPKDFGDYMERQYPVSAVIEMIREAREYASQPSPVMSAEQVDIEQFTCKMYSAFYGEHIDNINQLKKCTFDGQSLTDFISLILKYPASPSVKADGWVRIVTKKDFPKKRMYCWFYDKENGCVAGEFLNNGKDEINYILANATHYKPISLPAPPNVNNK